MAPNLFPKDIVFNISQLKFTAGGTTFGPKFDFSVVKSGDKVKIETLPAGVAPDKMVIDISKLKSNIGKLINILNIYKKKIDTSEYTDLANDINYAIKELPKFKSRLKNVIENATSKMTSDMFENQYAGFRKYKFIEILFSRDFKTIVSIRLLGPAARGRRARRFVIFNIPNDNLDINIVNLVSRSETIIDHFIKNSSVPMNQTILNRDLFAYALVNNVLNASGEGSVPNSPTEFVINNFIPPPPMHKKQSIFEDYAFLTEILKDISPKTYDLFNAQNLNFSDGTTKEKLFKANQFVNTARYFETLPLTKALSNSEKIQDLKRELGPFQCLAFLWENVFAKLDLCQTIQALIKIVAQFALDASGIKDTISNSSLIFLFEGIDKLPTPVRDIIYLNLTNTDLKLDLEGALSKVEQYVDTLPKTNSPIKCNDPISYYDKYLRTGSVSQLFKLLKRDYPNFYSDIENIFNQNFSRDAIIFILETVTDLLTAIDYCNFDFSLTLPNFKIFDLWGEFSFNLFDFLIGLLCELISAIFELLLNILSNLNKLDDFFNQFMNEENLDAWQQYVEYAFYFLIASNRAETPAQSISSNVSSILSTPEAVSIVQDMNRRVVNPNSSNSSQQASTFSADDYCQINSNNRTIQGRSFDDDIEYAIPGIDIDDEVIQDMRDTISQRLKSIGNRKSANEMLDKIKNFTYCKKYDFFATNNIIDRTTLDAIRQVSTSVPPLFESDLPRNVVLPTNMNQMSESLKNMFRQIQTVLSERELTDLITGNYSEEVASVVRVIARINFPGLTVKIDPIKYFTMLGKVVSTTIKDLKKENVLR